MWGELAQRLSYLVHYQNGLAPVVGSTQGHLSVAGLIIVIEYKKYNDPIWLAWSRLETMSHID